MDRKVIFEDLCFVRKFLSTCLQDEKLSFNAERDRRTSLLKIDDAVTRILDSDGSGESKRRDVYVSKDELVHYVDMHETEKERPVQRCINELRRCSNQEDKDIVMNNSEKIYENYHVFHGKGPPLTDVAPSQTQSTALEVPFRKGFQKPGDEKSKEENLYDSVRKFVDFELNDRRIDVVADDAQPVTAQEDASDEKILQNLVQMKNACLRNVRSQSVHCGYLFLRKWRFFIHRWERVYAIIKSSVMLLYKSESDTKSMAVIVLIGYDFTIDETSGKEGFILTPTVTSGRRATYRFRCDASELNEWRKALTVPYHQKLSKQVSEAYIKVAKIFDRSNEESEVAETGEREFAASDTADSLEVTTTVNETASKACIKGAKIFSKSKEESEIAETGEKEFAASDPADSHDVTVTASETTKKSFSENGVVRDEYKGPIYGNVQIGTPNREEIRHRRRSPQPLPRPYLKNTNTTL